MFHELKTPLIEHAIFWLQHLHPAWWGVAASAGRTLGMRN